MQEQNDGVAQFVRFACVETNELEDVFALDGNSTMKLARCGLYANSIAGISNASRIKDTAKIIKILQNTQRCFHRIYEGCVDKESPSDCFKESLLKELHGMLLEGNYLSVEYEQGLGSVWSYIPRGRYRAVPGYTTWMEGSDMCEIRFCPASKIDEEMEWYVTEVKKILLRAMSLEDKDPFRACAWVQWAFVRIHPFADGNGRMARLVSSIPLILNQLPPVYVSKASKPQYLAALIHADNTGDIDNLARFLKDEVFNALGRLLEGNDVDVEKAEIDFNSNSFRSITASSSSSSDYSGDSKIQRQAS
jgi:Fic family protein